MRLRPVGPDRLTLALANAQRGDDGRPEQEHDQRGGEESCPRAEGDVAEEIEELKLVRQFHEPDQHKGPFPKGLESDIAQQNRLANDTHLRLTMLGQFPWPGPYPPALVALPLYFPRFRRLFGIGIEKSLNDLGAAGTLR
ncbi:hypothetical protein ABIA25_001060 [Sinorhizobium fredii]